MTSPSAPDASEVSESGRKGRRRLPVAQVAAMGDQVLSGLSNFLAVALVARATTPDGFGHFAVAYALLIALITLARQLWGTRVAMTPAPAAALAEGGRLLGAVAWATPLGMAIVVLPSVLVTGPEAMPVIALLAVAVPFVVAQDLCRYAAIASGRPLVALSSDAVWVVVVAAAYAFRPTILPALVSWLAGAVLALIVGLVALRLRPSLSGGWASLRRRHPTSEVNALSAVAVSIANYVTLGLATVTLTAAAAGSLRGASTLMAPVNSVFAFVGIALLSVAYRTAPSRLSRLVLRVVALLLAVCVGWGVLLLAAPDSVGRLVLGDSWSGARAVLPFTVIEYVGLAVTVGVALGLQAAQVTRRLAVIALAPPAIAVCATVSVSSVASSAQNFAMALAVGSVVSALLAIVMETLVSARKRDRSSSSMDQT